MLGGTFTPAFAERREAQSNSSEILCNAAQMERVLRREIARADRGGRGFSLVLFRVRPGQSNTATRLLADLLLKRARLTDEVGWFSDSYLAALLTGTPADGARVFADGVCDAAAHHSPRPLAVVYTYPSEDSCLSLPADESDVRIEDDRMEAHGGKNGRSNGHRHNGKTLDLAHIGSRSSPVSRLSGTDQELSNFVQQGFNAEMRGPGLRERSMKELLAYPLPRWKRVLDICGAIAGLIALSPVMILTALAVRLSSPGPIIFKQKRSGLGGRPFTMYKFRTMVNGAEARRKDLEVINEQDGPAFKLKNDPRATKIGRILRKTSIDELPQFFNVLKGDMSLVGPRPLPCSESDGCLPWQRHRLNVTPGLTCIWQIKGRSTVTFDEWVRMDMAYIKRRALWQDLQILFATVPAVLLRRGAK